MLSNLPACLGVIGLAISSSCKSLTNLATPSFLSAAVRIDKEFLDIASITSTSTAFSEPVNLISKGLLGKDPLAILGPLAVSSAIFLQKG